MSAPTSLLDPTRCCPHPKNKHRRGGFKPCATPGCECAGYWRQHELVDDKPKAPADPPAPRLFA